MKTRIATLVLVMGLSMVWVSRVMPQQAKPSEQLPKYEVGVDFTTFILNGARQAHPGVGARLTYNLNRNFAIEGAAYFSPGNCHFCAGETTGRITEGLIGIKAGKRFKRLAVFGKVRPGVVNLSEGLIDLAPTGSSNTNPVAPDFQPPFMLVTRSRTDFAMDVGGVLETYPTKKLLLRFDLGMLVQRVGSRTFNNVQIDPVTGTFSLSPTTFPAFNKGSFQFISGVGFRF